ncbi:MAG: glycoside hydrolase family 30 protein [Pyrinomonadaceae bacterium]
MYKKSVTLVLIGLFLAAGAFGQKRVLKTSYSASGRSVRIITSTQGETSKMVQSGISPFVEKPQPTEGEISVFVNPAKSNQTFIGIGGAITDASAEVFAKLKPEEQKRFIDLYYSRSSGIGYRIARTNIHSCDFSSGSYTYVEEGDKELKTFDISHDLEYRIPLIKKAMDATGGKLKLYASPWSPPAFMKSNGEMLHGGKLLPEFYQPWANYFVKFIKAYESNGVPVWGVTIQNEPMATQRWESCIFSAEEERDFLKNNLGPTFARSGLRSKKIIVWDHNRDLINHRVDTILGDPLAAKFVWGVGFHWYEPWSGGQPMHQNVGLVHETYPKMNLLFTEGTAESFRKDDYENWKNAERYGRSMINDFNTGTVGWTDWNILLDERGGPNHVGNFCFAPIHADTAKGEIIITPSYYYIGHFSKYIEVGAKHVNSVSSRSSLNVTTFKNPDGGMVSVVMNDGKDKIDYFLVVGRHAAPVSIPAHSIQTLAY